MKVLLINVPSARRDNEFAPMIPIGLLYVSSVVERCGHAVKIYDPYLEDPAFTDFDNGRYENIFRIIREFNPDIVGHGGIATSYGRTKRLSQFIKAQHPDVFQIAGGALSSTYRLLLERTPVDVVFHGEVERSLPLFLEKFSAGKPYHDTPGVSFRSSGGIMESPPVPQVEEIDSIPFPVYDHVDVKKYMVPLKPWLDALPLFRREEPAHCRKVERVGEGSSYMPIVTSRGCSRSCSFCYRHMKGVRRNSVDYVIEHIRHLKRRFGVGGVNFGDELFNSDRAWVLSLCEAIERENLDIFYIIAGARVDGVDEQILGRLRDTGCVEINYGVESGSDAILKEYRKGVSSRQNRKMTAAAKRLGINCPVKVLIGSPSETSDTVDETIELLKKTEAHDYRLNYVIPLPGAPVWRQVESRGLVSDVETYLDRVAECGGSPLVNLTGVHNDEWSSWSRRIESEMTRFYSRHEILPLSVHPSEENVYRGSNMVSLMKDGDRLQVVPYGERKVRVGDVIAFSAPTGGRRVCRRVVAAERQGFRTSGDRGYDEDPWLLTRDGIIGRIAYRRRGNRRRRIYGGFPGWVFAFSVRAYHALGEYLCLLTRPAFHRLMQHSLIGHLVGGRIRPRIVSISRPEGTEMHLVWRHRLVGRLLPGKNRWDISRPYRPFVDSAKLPSGEHV